MTLFESPLEYPALQDVLSLAFFICLWTLLGLGLFYLVRFIFFNK